MKMRIYGEDTDSECDRGTSAVDGPSSSEFGLAAVHMEASANEGCRQLWKLCCLYHAWSTNIIINNPGVALSAGDRLHHPGYEAGQTRGGTHLLLIAWSTA